MAINWPSLTAIPKLQYGKQAFPVLLGHLILAAEAPNELNSLPPKKPLPEPSESPAFATAYIDAANAWIAYFHPQGKHYVPLPPPDDKPGGDDSLGAEVMDLIERSRHGRSVPVHVARKVMLHVATWAIKNKLAPVNFKNLVQAWVKGDYNAIDNVIPAEADIAGMFSAHAKVMNDAEDDEESATTPPASTNAPTPPDKPIDPMAPDAADQYLHQTFPDDWHYFVSVPMPNTATALEYKKLYGTTLVTGSKMSFKEKPGKFVKLLRAYATTKFTDGETEFESDEPITIIVFINGSGKLMHAFDTGSDDAEGLSDLVINGTFAPYEAPTVAQAPAAPDPMQQTQERTIPKDMVQGTWWKQPDGRLMYICKVMKTMIAAQDVKAIVPWHKGMASYTVGDLGGWTLLSNHWNAPEYLHMAGLSAAPVISLADTSILTGGVVKPGAIISIKGLSYLAGIAVRVKPAPGADEYAETEKPVMDDGKAHYVLLARAISTGPDSSYVDVHWLGSTTLDTLKPVVTTAGEPVKTIDYNVTDALLKWLAEVPATLAPRPASAPNWHIGTKFSKFNIKGTPETLALLGYAKRSDNPTIVAIVGAGPSFKSYALMDIDDLETGKLLYEDATSFSPTSAILSAGDKEPVIAFGADGNVLIGNGVTPAVDLFPAPILQPPFPSTVGKLSAGIVAVVPAGMNIGNADASHKTTSPCIVLVHPLGNFGGTKLTFPKGTVDPGEGCTTAAVREFFEETGMHAGPVQWLGDFESDSGTSSSPKNVTRMFIGFFKGGDPKGTKTNPWTGKDVVPETDSVQFHAVEGYAASAWFKKLNGRDKGIVTAAVAWINTHGIPADGMQSVCASDTTADTTFSTLKPKSWANFEHGTSIPSLVLPGAKQLPSSIDYIVHSYIVAMVDDYFSTKTKYDNWYLTTAGPLVTNGYPVPGCTVTCSSYDDPHAALRLFGYAAAVKGTERTTYAIIRKGNTGPVEVMPLIETTDAGATVFIAPGTFTLMGFDQPAVMATKTGPKDVYEMFTRVAPYPVTDTMVQILKVSVSAWSKVEEIYAFLTMSGPNGAVTAGQSLTVKYEPGKEPVWMSVIGFAQVKGTMEGANTTATYMFTVNDAGEENIHNASFVLSKAQSVLTVPYDTPLLVHPDPVMHALLAKAGSMGNPVQWMATRGYNAHAVLTLASKSTPKLPNMLKVPRALASLVLRCFTAPSAVSASQWNMLQSLAGTAPKVSKPAHAAPVSTYDSVTITAPPPAPVLATPFTAASFYALKGELDALDAAGMNDTGKKFSTGTNPHKVLIDAKTGKRYFLKGAKDNNPLRYVAEANAADIYAQFTPNILPVRVFEHAGFKGSMMPIVDGTPLPSDVTTYPKQHIVQVLTQHVLDMFWGDHDGKSDNWIVQPDGTLWPIDKGQSLRFFAQGIDAPIDSTQKGGNSVALPVGKHILLAWAAGKLEMPPAALTSMRTMIEKLRTYPVENIKAVTKPFADAAFKNNQSERDAFYTRILNWQKKYLDEWTKEMSKLAGQRGEQFKWPSVGNVAQPAPEKPEDVVSFSLDKVTPKSMGMTAREESIITKDVPAAKWRGKSIRVDKGFVENQEVFVKSVRYNAGGTLSDGILLTWRLTYAASEAATANLAQYAHEVLSVAGPQPLPFDSDTKTNDKALVRYFPTIRRALGHFNHNVVKSSQGGDPKGTPDVAFLENVLSTFIPELEDLLAQAQQSSSKQITIQVGGQSYKVAPSAIVAMVSTYMPHLQELRLAVDDWKKNGQNGAYWKKKELTYIAGVYKWTPPKEESKTPTATGYAITALKQGVQPNTTVIDGEKTMVLFEGGVPQYSSSFQFVIRGTGANKAIIHFNPAKLPGGQEGTKTMWGQCWATIPQAASPTAVAKVLALFEKATGIGMQTASKLDNEVLFWSKQAYALTPGYVQPDHKGSGLTASPELQQANALYLAGKDEQARDILVAYVAKELGTTPEKVQAMAAKSEFMQGQYSEVPGAPEGGAGRRRFMRLGYTRTDLFKKFGQDAAIAHNVKVPTKTFLQRALAKNGALVAKSEFALYVGPWQGDTSQAAAGSSASDFAVGGATNLFLGLRSTSKVYGRHIYFDIALMLRTDTYVVAPGGDGFGDFTRVRALSLEAIKTAVGTKGNSTGAVSDGETSQLVARHEVDLQEWLYYAGCEDATERDACIQLCKQYGVTSFFGGRSPEEVFVVAGSTPGIVK